jgi:diguanylate cyclase (GGDEF)-like protein/PAS domain S-box-containing protein
MDLSDSDALPASEPMQARSQAVLDALGEGLIVWDANGRCVSSNRSALEILGWSLDQLSSLDLDDLMLLAETSMDPLDEHGSFYPRHDYPAVVARREGAAVAGQVIGLRRQDGSRVWIEVDVQPLLDETAGELLVCSFRDVTAHKAVRDDTRFHSDILEALGQAVVGMDADGVVAYWNRAATELYGWPPSDTIGRSVFELMTTVTNAEIGGFLERARLGEMWSEDFELRRPDGTTITTFAVTTPVLDEQGELRGIISVSTDVTESRRADDQMRALSAIVESSRDSIVRLGVDGTIESWNGGAQALYGYTADEVIGRHGSILAPPDRAAEYESVLASALRGQSIEKMVTLRLRKNGALVNVALTASPMYDADGNIVGVSTIAGDVDELIAARDALEESEARFRSLVQRSADVAFVLGADGVIRYASPAVECFGYTPDDVTGTVGWDYLHPDDLLQAKTRLAAALRASESISVECRLRSANGDWRWTDAVVTDMTDVPAVGGIVANVRDVTDRHRAEQRRREAEERYRQGFERSAFGLAVLDLEQTFSSVNPALADLLGHSPERLLGRRPLEFLHPAETDAVREGAERLLSRDAPPHYKREHRMVRIDGTLVWVLIDMTVVRDADDEPSYYFVQVRDITDRKRAEEALEHQALHDDLTGLPNRPLLVDRLTRSLARVERSDNSLAVLFLDLDRFKLVNDGLGHVVGDQLLIEVARRLMRAMRGADTVARFGGDEFVIVREDVASLKDAIEFAERIAATLHEPVLLSGREVYATASIGIAFGGRGTSAEQLLRDADAAMYRAKDLGRARIELFSHELQQRVAARLDLETALRQAIDRDELELLYQPIVRLADGRVVGAEALLRWHPAGREVVQPADFIPVAEETGLIVPIGTWALEHALTELRALTPRHDADVWPLLAVNLSALQLRLPASIEMVRNAIRSSKVDPSMLSLEITESALMDDVEMSARAMRALRDLGVRLAVDDFGTGYSSLAYLKQLPVDSLKIDRSFINGLPGDPHDRSITQAIVTLGDSLGLTIVAEGVETVEQWIALDELGCTVGQGFLWSPPIPAAALAPLLTGLRRSVRAAPSTRNDAFDAN